MAKTVSQYTNEYGEVFTLTKDEDGGLYIEGSEVDAFRESGRVPVIMPLLGDYILSWEEMAWVCREMVKQQRKVLATFYILGATTAPQEWGIMPPVWTKHRATHAVRNAAGRFVYWKGGRTLSQMQKKKNTVHGTRIHIGHWFKKWAERRPQVGDHFRMRKPDGTNHTVATYYVYTPRGWRDTGKATKPTASAIAAVCAKARPSTGRR